MSALLARYAAWLGAALWLALPGLALAQAPGWRLEVVPDAREETVYAWSRERCEEWHIPDAPLRAFRDDKNAVVAFASHHRNRALLGPGLDAIATTCSVSFQAKNSPDPSEFSDMSWIAATWTGNGRDVFALMHDEYHADRHAGACRFKDGMACWYNVVTAARSRDSGRSFTVDEPRTLVAAPAFERPPTSSMSPESVHAASLRTPADGLFSRQGLPSTWTIETTRSRRRRSRASSRWTLPSYGPSRRATGPR